MRCSVMLIDCIEYIFDVRWSLNICRMYSMYYKMNHIGMYVLLYIMYTVWKKQITNYSYRSTHFFGIVFLVVPLFTYSFLLCTWSLGWAIDIRGQFSDLNIFARASKAHWERGEDWAACLARLLFRLVDHRFAALKNGTRIWYLFQGKILFSVCHDSVGITLPETNSSPLKTDGWKTICFWEGQSYKSYAS